jgi:hypothetical protein
MKMPLTAEQRQQRFKAVVSMIGLVLLGLIVAPIILTAIKGLLGLIVCVAILGVCWAAYQPVVMMLANWKLKMIKAEAWRNPTETLRHDYGKRENALNRTKERLAEMNGRIRAFKSTINGLRPKLGQAKLNEMLATAQQLDALYRNRVKKYEDARVKLGEFATLIEQAAAEWEASVAARDVTAAFSTGEDPLSQLKVSESLNAIQANLGAAMAALDTDLADQQAEARIMAGQEAAALPAPRNDNIIDVTETVEPEPVPIPARPLRSNQSGPTKL